MADLLPWLILFLFFSLLLSRRRRGKETQQRVHYQRLPGEELNLKVHELLPKGWKPLWLEDLPAPPRKRITCALLIDKVDSWTSEKSYAFPSLRTTLSRLECLLWVVAEELQLRTQAHVVVVEAFERTPAKLPAGTGTLRLLFSPDGRGWTGSEQLIAELDEAGQATESMALGQVHRKLLAAKELARNLKKL